MPMYHQLGKIPNKRHVVYRNSEGQMYNEELVGTQGFSSLSTLAYHIYPPTRVIGTGTPFDMRPRIAIENNMRMLSSAVSIFLPRMIICKAEKCCS